MKRDTTKSPKTKQYASDFREAAVKRFEARHSKDQSADEVADALGVSVTSLKRWQRARTPSRGRVEPTHAQKQSVECAIARLADDKNADKLSFLEALFKLMAWMRWPDRPEDHPAAMMVCVVTYLSRGQSVETVDQMKEEDRNLLLRHLRLGTLKQVCSDDVFSLPSFLEDKNDGQPFSNYDWLANVVWFYLAYKAPSPRKRDAVSSSKAYYATQDGTFDYDWEISQRTFQSYWSAGAKTAPFHYVERLHRSPDINIDPEDSIFSENIDALFERRAEVRRYLAQVSWVIGELRSRLDTRSLALANFPALPASLLPEPISIAELPCRRG